MYVKSSHTNLISMICLEIESVLALSCPNKMQSNRIELLKEIESIR